MSVFDDNYNSLTTFLSKWYEEPDMQGIYIALCTYQSHFWLNDPPIFLQIIGPASSGKTELAINPISHLIKENKCGREESTISKNSFLSGFSDEMGILPRLPAAKKIGSLIKSSGILTFPDFSTVIALHPDEVKAIMSDLRRVYDGRYQKTVGNRELQWEGKVSILAACTPSIEEYFIVHRDMGERWLSIKWRTSKNIAAYVRKAHLHMDNGVEIRTSLNRHIKQLLRHCLNTVTVNPDILTVTSSLAILAEQLRVSVKRDFSTWKAPVSEIGTTQLPMRISKNLVSIVRASAAIRCNKEIDDFDLALAKRICMDSIPHKRSLILDILTAFYPEPLLKQDLIYRLHCSEQLSKPIIDRTIEDLRFLNIISVIPQAVDMSGTGLQIPLDDDAEIYDDSTLYAIKSPKSRDLLALTPFAVRLLRDAKVI